MIDFKCYLDAFCEENDLAVSISYEMPAGYETAYGTYDVTINTIFINRVLIQNSPAYEALYYLFHELRHAVQYCHPERFDPAIQRSKNYVILYNGVCYKLVGSAWHTCTLDGSKDYFTTVYLNLPYEVDANSFAYGRVKEILGDSLELQELYDFWMPKVSLANEEYDKLFAWIDDNT